MYDFLWVSVVQVIVNVVFGLGGLVFLVEEILLFMVLVVVTGPLQKICRYCAI